MVDPIRDEAEALESALGDPSAAGPSGFAAALEADEADRFPQAAFDALVESGYFRNFVPVDVGGRLARFDHLLALGRVVARRDLAAAIAAGQCLLGALPVWLGGTDAQRAHLASLLPAGHSGSLALTEEDHGSDLNGNRVTARKVPHGYVLDGTKWAINNATRGRYLSVHARTSADGGNRGFSIVFVDKEEVDPTSLVAVPKIKTQGIRGADISGLGFRGTFVPETAIVGKEGHGLDLVLKTMQVSRTMCAAFSLGAADTALRMTLDFARRRHLYGAHVYALETVRTSLRDSFLRILVADALATVGTRSLSVLPEQMSVTSAIVKMLVPELANEAIRECSVVLGARHYFREGPYAAFTKLSRDAQLIPLFDGSSSVNRSIVAAQLPRIAAARAEERKNLGPAMGTRARTAADVHAPLEPFDRSRLRTSNRGSDDVLGGLDESVEILTGRAGQDAEYRLAERARELLSARRALDAEVRVLESRNVEPSSPAFAVLASRYAYLFAGACLVHLAAAAGPRLEAGLGEADVASLALRLLLEESGLVRREPTAFLEDPVDRDSEAKVDRLLVLLADDARLFSFVPFHVAGGRSFGFAPEVSLA